MPANPTTHWKHIAGDGLIYDGPCIVTHILVTPDANHDYADIYDGRDTTSGTRFCRAKAANRTTKHIGLGQGVHFGRGIYVDAYDAAVETTIAFIPLS